MTIDAHDMARRQIIDSRDVIDRIDELEALEADDEETFDPDDADELRQLREFADQGETVPDWHHGEVLIREDYFEEYARQLAEDIGAIDRDANWPLYHIDWRAAADDLSQDYTIIEALGETWYIR